MNRHIKLCAYLWYLGVRESLQLQRCIVLLALDEENLLWGKIWDCIKLHGGIFLGSIAWWQYVVDPCVTWMLKVTLQPVMGPGGAHAVKLVLDKLSQGLWMVPAYGVTLLVSCSWYNDVAERAVHVRQAHTMRLRATGGSGTACMQGQMVGATSSAAAVYPTSMPVSGGGGGGAQSGAGDSPYVGAAQELYRVTLFAVMYAEIYMASLLPVIGPGLSLLFTCWLYAYYCYDYQWTLRGIKLQDRLALFEGCAPFFAGYGLILAAGTAVLPFFIGAALMSLLFPVFVLVACDSHVMNVIMEAVKNVGTSPSDMPAKANITSPATPGAVAAQPLPISGTALAEQIHFRIPVFWLAALPTQLLLNSLFASRKGTGSSRGGKAKVL